jgi:hypothetical protein
MLSGESGIEAAEIKITGTSFLSGINEHCKYFSGGNFT